MGFYLKLSLGLFFLSANLFAFTRLKVQGSTTVNPVVSEAAEHFRSKGWKVFVDTQGGSSGGVTALGKGMVDLAMSSKAISAADRARFPKVKFVEHVIGYDGVALVVSKPVFMGGVKALDRAQIRAIYESKIKNWKAVGGPKRPIVFFNKEPGRGTWEVFAKYLYGKLARVPKVFHPEVGANEEARSKVAAHKSAITQLSAAWAEGNSKVHALGIRSGKVVYLPTLKNIAEGRYPLRRPLLLVTNGEAKGKQQAFLKFLQQKEGQALVKKFGYLPIRGS